MTGEDRMTLQRITRDRYATGPLDKIGTVLVDRYRPDWLHGEPDGWLIMEYAESCDDEGTCIGWVVVEWTKTLRRAAEIVADCLNADA